MTKKKFIESLRGTKVYVDGKSKEIQERLFELGFEWANLLMRGVDRTDCAFLYIGDKGSVSFGSNMETFSNSECREVTASYILNTEFEENHEFKPFDKVLVRCGSANCIYTWNGEIFSHYDSKGKTACLGGAIYDQVIPYKGNEHLLGTNKSPKT